MNTQKIFLAALCGAAMGFTALLSACGDAGGSAPAPTTTFASLVVAVDEGADAPHQAVAAVTDEVVSEVADSPGDHAGVQPGDFVLAGYLAGGTRAGLPALDEARSGADTHSLPSGATLYVSPYGADANPGTEQQPLRSLARAVRLVRPGTTVYVAPGEYSGGFRSTISGSADARIAFVSTSRWGARIVPPARSLNRVAWDNRGSYVDIIGFDFDGSAVQEGVRWTHGIYNGGSYDVIRNNYVHDIATGIACTNLGGAGIGVDSYYRGVRSDVIGNRVEQIGPPGCRFVQGIYMSTSGSIKNNVVARVSEGGIHLWHDASHVIITNNTVTESNTGIIVGGGNYYFSSGPNDYTAVYSNIVFNNRMGISEQGQTGLHNSYRNNLVYQNAVYDWRLKNGLTHTGTVCEPPALEPDLRLSAGSPAIGMATPKFAARTDFDGRARDASTGYDIGAYQHY